MASFVAQGADIVQNANVATNSSLGQDGAGQITVTSGTSPFPDGYIIEFEVINVATNGEFSTSTAFTGITVYASEADYIAGTPIYTYTPQNAGQTAAVQDSTDRIGDEYIQFNANILTSSDPGAPNLNSLFVAPGSNIGNQTSTVFDHHTDIDYDGSGGIDAGTIEDGNGFFNIANSSTVCFDASTYILTPNGQTPILDLLVGDCVVTADNGPQKIVWIGKRHVTRLQLITQPKLRPVLIPQGVLGAHIDTLVSRQHALVTKGGSLMRSAKLAGRARSRMRIANGRKSVTYLHLMFDSHQIIFANGIAAESFYPGPHALRALTKRQLHTLRPVLPDIVRSGIISGKALSMYGAMARPIAH
ncbi:Hint domain-containing protein [Octadecabacter sp. G9-8]|uniref:Hint domain-containing protein n=1 Tax=Octadecabacter dasysiphoniae TaxID=2909341 RepID=A0ABS9CUY6_9RHOB|nr:Hint domain-containing protein [Octadecabacter dasysiphoniae]MCF2870872.1 Hint domain-containing protein [Octadecabacter dasysiphoniae]